MISSAYDAEKAGQSPEISNATTDSLQPTVEYATYYEDPVGVGGLSEAHRAYLLQRHGTLNLDPLPSFSDADPYNWTTTTKVVNLLLVAFHAMMATFTAASIQSAFETIAKDLHVSLQRTTYLTSLFIAILGGAPFFWQPLSKRYGRRPIFLISLVCSAAGNIGCAKSPSYATMGLCRAIVAFFISTPAAIGSAVVKETFFKRDRARYMGIWTLMVTLGVPVAPFIFGFVAQRVGYRWIYWILAITNGVQFVLYLFLGPETRYIRNGDSSQNQESAPIATATTTAGAGAGAGAGTIKQEYFTFRRIDPTPLSIWDFIGPLRFFSKLCVLIPAVAYSMVFCLSGVMVTVEIPTLFGDKFGFDTQQLGLQYLGVIIGSLIGELIGGFLSDHWMTRRTKKKGGIRPDPEFRLWLSYGGYLLAICGVIVFLVQIENAAPLHWNVSPIVGSAIGGAGNQIVTTVLITYAVDCYPEEAAAVGVFITFVRQIWGFIGPFWFPQMFSSCGLYISAVISTVLMVGCSIIPTAFIQWQGRKFN